jgi:Zn-dependent protease
MDFSQLDIPMIATRYAILLLSLTLHETAHAWTADRFGDPTARNLGRVSLSPLVHIDPIGTVLFPLLQLISPGLPLLGWAKPVPVNPLNLQDPRRMGMWISAAGPASNLLLGSFFLLLLGVGARTGLQDPGAGGNFADAPITTALKIGLILNVMLAFFNFLPIPPLDGGGVAAGILPRRAAEVLESIGGYGFFILYALMLVPLGGRSLLTWLLTPAWWLVQFAYVRAVGA